MSPRKWKLKNPFAALSAQLYAFSGASITKSHKQGLKTTDIIFLQFQKPEVPNEGVGDVGSFLGAQRENGSILSPDSWWLL